MVARAAPFQLTTEFAVKLAPFTVRVNAAAPAVAEEGERDVIAGSGLMGNVELAEVPTEGFETEICAVPAAATSAADIAALNWVVLTTVVARGEPFQFTTELPPKFEPFTVRVKAAPPAVAEEGEREVMDAGAVD